MPQIIKPTTVAANGRVIISLCDFSGNWPRPFADYGYTVLHYDLKHGDNVLTLRPADIVAHVREALRLGGLSSLSVLRSVAGVLSAPPCTDFSVSGAQYWPAKDANGTTAAALAVVDACMALSTFLSEICGAWWCLENPVGRLPKLRPALGKPAMYFQPVDYAHFMEADGQAAVDAQRYTKKTGLWGTFNAALLKSYAMENDGPIRVCPQGSWLQKLGGKSERTKELRSMTPQGFAEAFAWVQYLTEFNNDTFTGE